jgi:benzoyl-CoA reductase subunit C
MPEPMFPTWKDRPFEEILLQCEDLLEDMDFPTARRWRQGGGQLIGHFQVYFPEEIVHAAGLLPIKMRGAPLEPRKADSRFGSYLCSILKTSLELAMT